MKEALPTDSSTSSVLTEPCPTTCATLGMLCQILRAFNAPHLIVLGGITVGQHADELKQYGESVARLCSVYGCAALFPHAFWTKAYAAGLLAQSSDAGRLYAAPTKTLLSHMRVGLENFVRLAVALYTTPKEQRVLEVMPGVSFNEAGEPSWRLAPPLVPPPGVSSKNCLALHEHFRKPRPHSQSCAWLQQTPARDPTRQDVWSPLLVPSDCIVGWPTLASCLAAQAQEYIVADSVPEQDLAIVQCLSRHALTQATEVDPQSTDGPSAARQTRFFMALDAHARDFATKRTDCCSTDGPPWPYTAMLWHLMTSMLGDTLPGSPMAANA